MYFVGVDYSINYASYCVSKNFDEFHFGTVINDKSLSNSFKNELVYLSDSFDGINFQFSSRAGSKSTKDESLEYHEEERLKMANFIEISSKLVNRINIITGFDQNVIFGMEGFSYGSEGNAAFDIPCATGIFRRDVAFDILHSNVNKFFVFSPSELKKAIGCKGNDNKIEIVNKFIQDPIIPKAKECGMHSFLSSKDGLQLVFKKNGEVRSPFNDMVDAYLPVVKFFNDLK